MLKKYTSNNVRTIEAIQFVKNEDNSDNHVEIFKVFQDKNVAISLSYYRAMNGKKNLHSPSLSLDVSDYARVDIKYDDWVVFTTLNSDSSRINVEVVDNKYFRMLYKEETDDSPPWSWKAQAEKVK